MRAVAQARTVRFVRDPPGNPYGAEGWDPAIIAAYSVANTARELSMAETHTTTSETARPAVTPLDVRILRALPRIIQPWTSTRASWRQSTISPTPQLVTLLWIVESGSSTASDIARQIHVSNSTVVGILDRLESKGLVRRERSTYDRRLVHICATEAGITLARSAPSPLQDVFANAFHELPEREQNTIALSLERIVDLMEARDIEAAPLLATGDVPELEETLG